MNMENVSTKASAAPRPTTTEEQAISKVPSEEKNLSKIPFQGKETLHIPGMQIMPFSQSEVCGSEKEESSCPDAHQNNKLQVQDRNYWYSITLQYRIEAKACLDYLVKYDDGISVHDTQKLCDAINAIDRAVIVA